MKSFKKGIFTPTNIEKYKGKKKCYYRSSYELKFMRFLDVTESILEWCCECVTIGYINPLTGMPARYYPDFLIKYKNKDGDYKIDLIEIKPFRETKQPKIHGNKKRTTLLQEQKTWLVNSAKWEAARSFCERKNINFRILTEKELNIH